VVTPKVEGKSNHKSDTEISCVPWGPESGHSCSSAQTDDGKKHNIITQLLSLLYMETASNQKCLNIANCYRIPTRWWGAGIHRSV